MAGLGGDRSVQVGSCRRPPAVVSWGPNRIDVFGLGTLLKEPFAYFGSAETVADSEMFVWERDAIRRFTAANPQIVENSFRIVFEHLGVIVDRHAGLISQTAEQRLADSLLRLGSRSGNVHSEGVDVSITNEQLGNLANTSPFTASRMLRKWKRMGAVSKRRGRVIIHTPEALLVD